MRRRILFGLLIVCLVFFPDASIKTNAATPTSVYLPLVLNKPETLTTYQLIDQAVQNGEITAETGLIYKVYADFNDPRLPTQYKGNDINTLEGIGLSDALGQWDSLSPTAQAILQPFFIPPIYSGSWANLNPAANPKTVTQSGPVTPHTDPQPPDCGGITGGWISQDAKTAPVRFWGKPGQETLLANLSQAVDGKIWSDLTNLFGDQPLSDSTNSCNGGDGRLDIYLVTLGRSYTIPYSAGCSQTPAYILFDPVAYQSELYEITAHEMSHAFQFAYKVTSCPDTGWIREATATYAQQYVYPSTQTEQRTAPWYLNYPATSLNFRNDSFEYGAYTFFFYLSLTTDGPGVVKKVWAAMATQKSLDALNASISNGFKQHWPEFALWNLNKDPYKEYSLADSLPSSVRLALDAGVTVPGKDLTSQDVGPSQMSYLTQDQVHLTFPDYRARTVFIYNGWSYNLAPAPLPGLLDGSPAYTPTSISSDQLNGRALWIVPKVQGVWAPLDMTHTGFKVFCMDEASKRPSELYLIHTNSLLSGLLTPPGQRTTLFATNIGCWHWQGRVDFMGNGFESHATNLLWERSTPLETQIMYKLVQGTLNWKITAPGCTGQGTFDLATAQGSGTIMVTYNNLISGGTYRRFLAHGDLANPDVTVVCNGHSGTVQLPFWGDSNLYDPSGLFKDDGTIDNTFSPGGMVSWHWQLTPLSDP